MCGARRAEAFYMRRWTRWGVSGAFAGVAVLLASGLVGCTVGTDGSLQGTTSPTATTGTTTGSPAGGVSTGASAFAVSGQVFDGPVSNAGVGGFADPAFALPLTGATGTSDGFGKFSFTVPATGVNGLAWIYVKSHAGQDSDTLDAPGDMAGIVSTTGNGVLSVTPVSTLAVKLLALDRAATVPQARTQVKALFGLDDSVSIDPGEVVVGSELQVMIKTLLNAGTRAHPELGSAAARTDAVLNDLAGGLANGNTDTTALADSFADLSGRGQGDSRLAVHPPPEFTLDGVLSGVNRIDVTTMTVAVASDHLQELAIPSVPASSGTTLPDVALDFALHSDQSAVAHFPGSVEIDVKGRAPDQRLLTLKFDGVTFQSPGAADITVAADATLTAGGVDSTGAVVTAITVPNLPTNAAGIITVAQLPSDRRVTFHMTPTLGSIITALGGLPAQHPAQLLDATSVVDVSVTFRGFPTRTAAGRVRRVVLPGVIRQ